jgi:inner membrane protein
MDNITHSLVGYAVAKTAKHLKVKGLSDKLNDPKVSLFFIFISILAANFPDLDLIYSLYDSSKLGYLVHHRGHTHTFLLALPQAVIALVFSALVFRIKDKILWLWGFIFILVNIILHISLDALNIYGVHPFFPWDNQWYYGDSVFIIEPLIWFSLLPLLLTPIKKIISLKNLVIVFFLLTLVLAVFVKMMSVGTSIFLLIYFLGMLLVYNKMFESTKSITSICFTVLIVLGFMVEGIQVESKIKTHLATTATTRLVDLAITPYPGNPFCWNVYVTQVLGDDGYRVSIGQFQSARIWGFDCPEGMLSKDKNTETAPKIKNMTWYQVHLGSVKEIFNDHGDCRLQNWFQFVRIPFINKAGDYVDLRFSNRSSNRNFTQLDLMDKEQSCVKVSAPWIAPRSKLF